MADQRFRKRVILWKIEGTEGVDASPTGGANAIRCSEPTIVPRAGGYADRNTVRETLGAFTQVPVDTHVTVEFGVEIAGSGAAGTAPAWGPVLRSCGMAETVNAGVSVVYDPVSEGEESGTGYFHADPTLHKLLGAKGNPRLVFPANDFPHFMFPMTGLFVAPAASALPTPDYTPFIDGLPISKVNTPTFTLHGFAAVLESLELDFGNVVQHRDRPNSKQVKFLDRQITGTVSFEAPALATKNFFAIAEAGTLGTMQLIHGTAAGNIFQADATKVQVTNPRYVNSDGLQLLQLDLRLTPDAGDDEISITLT